MFNKKLEDKIKSLEWDVKYLKEKNDNIMLHISCLRGNHQWTAGTDKEGKPCLYCRSCYCSPENKPEKKPK